MALIRRRHAGHLRPRLELIFGRRWSAIKSCPCPAPAPSPSLGRLRYGDRRFRYVGFLPRSPPPCAQGLQSLKGDRETIVAYESPYRLAATLALIAEVMGAERRVCVARELSKKFEQFYRGSAGELRDYFAADNPRGEVTLVIAGADPNDAEWTEEQVRSALRGRLAAGEALSRAARAVAKSAGWPKNKVYQLGIKDG